MSEKEPNGTGCGCESSDYMPDVEMVEESAVGFRTNREQKMIIGKPILDFMAETIGVFLEDRRVAKAAQVFAEQKNLETLLEHMTADEKRAFVLQREQRQERISASRAAVWSHLLALLGPMIDKYMESENGTTDHDGRDRSSGTPNVDLENKAFGGFVLNLFCGIAKDHDGDYCWSLINGAMNKLPVERQRVLSGKIPDLAFHAGLMPQHTVSAASADTEDPESETPEDRPGEEGKEGE